MQPSARDRLLISGAVWGPAGFVLAWVVAGMLMPGHSAVDSPISELAAVDAATRPLVTAGIAAYVVGVGGAAWPMRRLIGHRSAGAAGISAAASAGVMLAPLDVSATVDAIHAAFALLAYLSTAAMGLLAAAHTARSHRGFAAVSLAVGVLSGVALGVSLIASEQGLYQRIGLTLTDAWLIAVGLWGVVRR